MRLAVFAKTRASITSGSPAAGGTVPGRCREAGARQRGIVVGHAPGFGPAATHAAADSDQDRHDMKHASTHPAPQGTVFCLNAGQSAWRWIEQRLARHQVAARGFDRVTALIPALLADPDAVVVLFTGSAPRPGGVTEVSDQLARQVGLAPSLICVAPANDPRLRLESVRAGCHRLLVTPLDEDTLLSALLPLLGAGHADPERILVVEEDRAEATHTVQILEQAGFEVQAPREGLEAVQVAAAFKPNLLVLGLKHPGVAWAARIRDQDASGVTPIVYLSPDPDAQARIPITRLGIDEQLLRPVSNDTLVATVRMHARYARALRRARTIEAPVDPATGLLTRQTFVTTLEGRMHEEGFQRPGRGLLFVCIDDAAQAARAIGVGGGGTLLGHVAEEIRSFAGGEAVAARYAEQGFTLLVQRDDDKGLAAAARGLQQALGGRMIDLGHTRVALSVSIGVAPCGDFAPDAATLISRGERACQAARATGHEHVEIVRAPAAPSAGDDTGAPLGTDIEQALTASGLMLLFQPLLALHDDIGAGVVERYECLLRLERHPDGPSPQRPDASDVAPELRARVDRWAMDQTLAHLASGHRAGARRDLFVHQCVQTICNRQWLRWMRERLATLGLSERPPILVFNQEDLLAHLRVVAPLFDLLLKIGVRLCVDQFSDHGAARSLLARFPISFAFPRDELVARPDHRERLSGMVGHAHARRVKVIARGITDAEAMARVWECGVDFVQGPFVQTPQPDMGFDFEATNASG